MRIITNNKKALIILVLCISAFSCNSNKNIDNATNKDNISKTNSKPMEDFNEFYERFHNDEIFQLDRIKFPVSGSYNDFDTVKYWTKENWGFIRFTVDEIDTTEYNAFLIKKDSIVIEEVNCKGCGYSAKLIFEIIDSKWYITHKEINNF